MGAPNIAMRSAPASDAGRGAEGAVPSRAAIERPKSIGERKRTAPNRRNRGQRGRASDASQASGVNVCMLSAWISLPIQSPRAA